MVAAAAAAAAAAPVAPAVLAEPTFPSPVSAAGGVVAYATGSGPDHRFEIVVRRAHSGLALTATSAAGWIDGVDLGSDSAGRAIVIYSHCPHQPFAPLPAGRAGTDGCRLWWAPISGSGPAHEIAAAPPDTDIGAALHGTVTFAVQPSTGAPHAPVRLETASLTGATARALTVPTPDGATINGIAVGGAGVAFQELPAQPDPGKGLSEIWLETAGSAPELVAKQAYQVITDAQTAHYFDGLALTAGSLYAFLVADRDLYPAVPSQLERISLPSLATTAIPWRPGSSLRGYGIQQAAFDPGDGELALSFYSESVDFEPTSAACSQELGSVDACPVAERAVTFASGPPSTGTTGTTAATGPTGATSAP